MSWFPPIMVGMLIGWAMSKRSQSTQRKPRKKASLNERRAVLHYVVGFDELHEWLNNRLRDLRPNGLKAKDIRRALQKVDREGGTPKRYSPMLFIGMLATVNSPVWRSHWMNKCVWKPGDAGDAFERHYSGIPRYTHRYTHPLAAISGAERQKHRECDTSAILTRFESIKEEHGLIPSAAIFWAIYEYVRSGEHVAEWVQEVNAGRTPAYPFIPDSK